MTEHMRAYTHTHTQYLYTEDFPGGSVVKNPPSKKEMEV